MAGLSPNDADRRIAGRVLRARREAHVTQSAAGAVLGVSSAQFQKYEKGVNRLTGGMLQALAALFGVPVASFFDPIEDAPTVAPTLAQTEVELRAAAERFARAKADADARVLARFDRAEAA